MNSEFCVVTITAPKGKAAHRLAEAIVTKRLAACVNVLPSVNSVYWWKGKRESAGEAILIAKTRRSLFKKLMAHVEKIHPYDVPEILALPIVDGNTPYLRWLRDETR